MSSLQNVGPLLISDRFSRHSTVSFNWYRTDFTLFTLHSQLVSAQGLTVIFTLSFNTSHLLDKPENNVYSLYKTPKNNLAFVQDAAASTSTKLQL
jgi:hypothetical protein